MKGCCQLPHNGSTGVSYKLSRRPRLRARVLPQGLKHSSGPARTRAGSYFKKPS
jgi:hypothetical protein